MAWSKEKRKEYMREYAKVHGPGYRNRNRNAGKCRCGRELPGNSLKSCESCRKHGRDSDKKIRDKRRSSGLCVICGKKNESNASKCWHCNRHARNYTKRQKEKVIQAYGGKCECCDESCHAFLTIDHINDDGNVHRKTVSGGRIYNWLEKNGFPKDNFRLLCFNCNCGRRVNGGVCPHKSKQ